MILSCSNTGDVILDCGVNVGDLFIWFQNKNLNIEYIGFEPSSKEYECLKENVTPHKTYNVGLWCEEEILTFYASSQNGDSSIIAPGTYDEVIEIKGTKLSRYINQQIKLLKLEAEGGEPEILVGLGDEINKIEYISADLGYERGDNRESTLIPVINYLYERNFELINISHGRVCALFKNRAFALPHEILKDI